MRYAALLAATLAVVPAALHAQVRTVDEGRFTISRGGQRIGSEDFAIRRMTSPGGDVLTASATVAYNDRRLSPALRADTAGVPLAYQVDVKVGPDLQESLRGMIGRGRFSARVKTPRGESAKEYVVADGALIVDDDVFHQYYFLAQADRSGSVAVVIPRRNVQITMHVDNRGTETLDIGGTRVQARHLVLTDGGVRHVWVDALGRVLKVTLDDSGVSAVRDELPR